MKRTEQYLKSYAESEVSLSDSIQGTWAHSLVVPVCDEGDNVLDLLESVEQCQVMGRILVVLVINGRVNAQQEVHQRNAACAGKISAKYPLNGRIYSGHQIDIVIIDRFTEPCRLRPKEGVGLARKIGCDLIVALHHRGQFVGRWIGSTDADALLPKSYFSTLEASHYTALTFPFKHLADAGFEDAMALYELSLHHYVLGLEWAGSPYAFHTIGSTIAISVVSYITTRGFPKRLAGEDFYLLNKVAKLGPIYRSAGLPITLQGRPSTRVPFGTGPALLKIRASDSFTMFDPEIFEMLRRVLAAFKQGTPPPYLGTLDALGFPSLQKHLATSIPPKQRLKHAHDWFDGFRTLKFIHAKREDGYPNLPWQKALMSTPWWQGKVPDRPVDALAKLRAELYPGICGSTPKVIYS